jgi:membrane protein required for colicin V production
VNAFDIFILILLILGCLNGLRLGLIRALSNLLGWMLSFILAMRFHEQLQPWMQAFTADHTTQKILSFILIVAVVVVLTWLVGYFLQRAFSFLKLSWLNRLAGGAFGLAKSLVVFLVLIHVLNPWFVGAKFWKNAKFVQLLRPYAGITTQYSQEFVQITTEQFESHQSDENNRHRDGIMQKATASDGQKSQVANPFR